MNPNVHIFQRKRKDGYFFSLTYILEKQQVAAAVEVRENPEMPEWRINAFAEIVEEWIDREGKDEIFSMGHMERIKAFHDFIPTSQVRELLK